MLESQERRDASLRLRTEEVREEERRGGEGREEQKRGEKRKEGERRGGGEGGVEAEKKLSQEDDQKKLN